MCRLLALLLAVLGLVLLGALPAEAATKNAGIPDLTPYGGYLGNYLAPDGSRVYCIDSPLPWPSGSTSGPSAVDALVTTWGSSLSATELRKLNYVLLTYGQTDDPSQAAAVAAYVNAYTSGWARDLGAGYAAGAWYLNGNAGVTSVYDVIWADAEANATPTGSASVAIDMTQSTVTAASSPGDASGTLTLTGAVRADTGESSFPISANETIPIRGTPGDVVREYTVSASATFTAPTAAGSNLVLYTTGGQQRTVRGGAPGSIEFSAVAQTEVILLDFVPVITTAVESVSAEVGSALVDRVTVGLADGSRPWRNRADGTPVPIVAAGVLYGPLTQPPTLSEAVPPGAPVATTEALTVTGAGGYRTSGFVASEPGYYTWVWSIDAARQDTVGAASLPDGYLFVSQFGLDEETHLVSSPPRRLANTGSATFDAGAVGIALIGIGALVGISARAKRWA